MFFSAEGLYEGDSFIRFDEIDENNEAKREQAIEAAINKGNNWIDILTSEYDFYSLINIFYAS